ncbi:molecular chaperone [Pseudorhodoferax sp. Leaf274]|uniref:TorD/DmsD family molecular chaperone n=1 Tax=Pseudorhodoferax sp. Leaf274 TaxID=1736318 RepID=UPI0007038519|nr:molecular chaperone TorD family protein [Pseudorhodoferax sp. Leaf274]KQP45121.1 cytochrome C oxidase subunit II [Pseudorhodoferax sp. Leaf274]
MTTETFSEEIARAELYGLLARLWLAPPDEGLLAQFQHAVTEAPEPGSFLEGPWQDLVAQMRATTPASGQEEFAALFQGVGKPEVFAYASFYLAGFVNEKPLARLREDLAALGLTRDAAQFETEDHVSYVLEVMRYLIAGEGVAAGDLARQRRFFRAHVQPWIEPLCQAVDAQSAARLWRAIAAMTLAFVQVETQAFDLIET